MKTTDPAPAWEPSPGLAGLGSGEPNRGVVQHDCIMKTNPHGRCLGIAIPMKSGTIARFTLHVKRSWDLLEVPPPVFAASAGIWLEPWEEGFRGLQLIVVLALLLRARQRLCLGGIPTPGDSTKQSPVR